MLWGYTKSNLKLRIYKFYTQFLLDKNIFALRLMNDPTHIWATSLNTHWVPVVQKGLFTEHTLKVLRHTQKENMTTKS
jgi:hypothetical protein